MTDMNLSDVMDKLPPPGARVAVGLSGGVDSSMTAWLLKKRGCEVVGLTMSIWDAALPLPDRGLSGCFGPGEARDLEAASRLCERLKIPYHVVRLADEYRKTVLDYFRREYLAGRTPNPCMRCNQAMKFGFLLERARDSGVAFDFFATGHYARLDDDPATGRRRLLRGRDRSKDQSYFLALLGQPQLRALTLPLGGLTKAEVKALARNQGFADLADKPESQDFIESDSYDVLFDAAEARPGEIVDEDGRVLGRHEGIVRYTIGQRKGLGIGGAGEPLYVVALDAKRNRVVVGRRSALFRRAMRVAGCNWIARETAPEMPLRATARIRFRHEGAPAEIRRAADAPEAVDAIFDEAQASITPGQTAVFYDGDAVLGAGEIVRATDS